MDLRRAVLAPAAVARDLATELMRQQLHAVADAEHGQAALQNLLVHLARALVVDTIGSTGKDDAASAQASQLVQRGIGGQQLAVDAALTHAPRDQAAVLRAVIEDGDHLAGSGLRRACGSRRLIGLRCWTLHARLAPSDRCAAL